MTNDVDVLRTWNTDMALTNGFLWEYDHELLVENLGIRITPQNATNGSCIVVFQPGEASTIRNVNLAGGRTGVRCFGGGAPGLRIRDSSASNHSVALWSVESYLPNGTYVAIGGQVSLLGCSGDSGLRSRCTNACWFNASQFCGGAIIRDFKAEGAFGGGLFHYNVDTNMYNYTSIGYLDIQGGSYNVEDTAIPADLVVLDLPSTKCYVPVSINPMIENGAHYIINDKVHGVYIPCPGGLATIRLGYPSVSVPLNLQIKKAI